MKSQKTQKIQKPNKGNTYPASTSSPQRLKVIGYISLIVILLITIIIYSNSIRNDFVTSWDDNEQVTENNDIKALNVENFKKIFTSYYCAMYQPLSTTTYAMEYKLFKLNPLPYHTDNLILHLLNIALVFWLIWLMVKRYEVAAIVALLFAIHPMHVESVSWISERKDVLYTFFYLLSIIYYMKFIEIQKPKNPNVKIFNFQLSIINYLLSITFFICSALSKSAAIILPVVLLLFDYYYFDKLKSINLQTKKTNFQFSIFNFQLYKVPFFIVSIIFGIIALKSQSSGGALNYLYTEHYNFSEKFCMVTWSVSYYFINFFLPIKLAALHYFPYKTAGSIPSQFYWSVPALLFILFIIYRLIIFSAKHYALSSKYYIFGLLFFFLNILLIIQFVPFGSALVAERYTYVPYIGLAFIIAQLYVSMKSRMFFNIVLGAFAIYFMITTFNRNEAWNNSLALFKDNVEKNPDFGFANYNFGYENLMIGQFDQAIPYFDKAIKLQSKFDQAYFCRGYCKQNLKDYKAAIDDYTISVKMNDKQFDAYNNMGTAKALLGNFKGAVNDYSKALESKQDYSTLSNRGNAYLRLLDYPNAIKDYNVCISMKPQEPVTYFNRGIAEYYLKNHDAACNDFNQAAKLNYKPAVDKIKELCENKSI